MSGLLDSISLPQDIKTLSQKELEKLSAEIREFLIQNISKTGGHLASNLGAVELTLALYKSFDFPADKVVWDVGHQAYVHKILSGRKDKFPTLRKFGGMSGFPKTAESEFDSFNTGHSSTSVSAALGMARTRDLEGKKHNVIAVFGDGALTGGMMYEALNDAGHTNTRLILVLNDNAMSISRNVGAISKHLRNLRSKPGYFRSKKRVEKILSHVPLCGRFLANCMSGFKRIVRSAVLGPSMFDELGIKYIGPIDGHNISAMSDAFSIAKDSQKPIILHVRTKKGKGYLPAENNPQYFHGVSEFDVNMTDFANSKKTDYSAVFGRKLCELAKDNEKIVAVTAAMPIGTGLDEFAESFKSRFFDVGIAEEHAVTLSAGMAISGYTPVVALYSSFAQPAYDQILHDVCLQKLHVVFCIDRAGIVGADGETHHGLYDIAYFSHMPNMSVLSPSCFNEFEEMLDYAVNTHSGPIAIRYPRGNEQFEAKGFTFGKAEIISEGDAVTVAASGRMMKRAEEVCRILKEKNITAEFIGVPTILPFDTETVADSAKKTGLVAVIEDHSAAGGLGSIVSEALSGVAEVVRFAYPREAVTHGTTAELDAYYRLDAQSIADKITEMKG